MKSMSQLMLAAIFSLCWFHYGMAQSPLNDVKIGQCQGTAQIDGWIEDEKALGLVMDSRPFAINQSSGKLLFTRGAGRVTVIHMNPFVYNYKISVAQQELISTALTDFGKLLLPPTLAALPGLQSGEAGKQISAAAPNKLRLLEARLMTFNLQACEAAAGNEQNKKDACAATNEMLTVFNQIQPGILPTATLPQTLDNSLIKTPAGATVGGTNSVYASYVEAVSSLRNEQFHAFDTCTQGEQLNNRLRNYDFDQYFADLNVAQNEISRLTSLADDLEQLATNFTNQDAVLKTQIIRCSGFNCASQFLQYAQAVKTVLGRAGYQLKLENLHNKGQEMQNMLVLTDQMRNKEGLFARTFPVTGKFELTQATISVKREPLRAQQQQASGTQQSGTVNAEGQRAGAPAGSGAAGVSSEGSLGSSPGPAFVPPGPQTGTLQAGSAGDVKKDENPPAGSSTALVGEVNEVIQLGRPRFSLSGGLVYSPLPRRTFEKAKGFVLDAEGNPTGDSDANVIGFKQNSPRRLLPMLFLNSRVLDYGQGSMYFSFGITAKKDDNVDLEYLVGPAFSFLNDRALFTFGAYGGLTQNLVDDVRVGQEIPDALGDALFYRKRITWKPGFSFSYALSQTKKRDVQASGGKPAAPGDDLKNEIRIGSIPFNLAVGMAYTSLEQRTYDEIAGLARDQQGNLTNGQTLARIVGLTSSSSYRLTPLAMLHSRLTNFGAYDFYFTTGLTGKKTKDDFDLEYLLGGSVNVYERKIFLTFGTFIGKQQVLAPGFFEGMALDRGQSITTQNRYVWKPAISLSYDISRIITRPN